MKCQAWVIVKKQRTPTKGLWDKVRSVSDNYEREETLADVVDGKVTYTKVRSKLLTSLPPGATLCGGRIVASVDVEEEEPEWGGTSCTFVCTLTCERCKHTYHGPDVPTTPQAISLLVTAAVAAMPDPDATNRLTFDGGAL